MRMRMKLVVGNLPSKKFLTSASGILLPGRLCSTSLLWKREPSANQQVLPHLLQWYAAIRSFGKNPESFPVVHLSFSSSKLGMMVWIFRARPNQKQLLTNKNTTAATIRIHQQLYLSNNFPFPTSGLEKDAATSFMIATNSLRGE